MIRVTDLVGFTTFAEDLPASEVADLLNEHFTLVGECVEREDGTLDKFIGDSMMAFWGAPIGQPDQADRACRAATGIARAMRDQNARRSQAARPPLQIRVGIHTGQVVVGNIGARSRVNYTIIGDAVNTTQRLEELARTLADLDQDCYTLVSVETAKRVKGEFPLKYVGRHALRGRHEPLAVYRLEAE